MAGEHITDLVPDLLLDQLDSATKKGRPRSCGNLPVVSQGDR